MRVVNSSYADDGALGEHLDEIVYSAYQLVDVDSSRRCSLNARGGPYEKMLRQKLQGVRDVHRQTFDEARDDLSKYRNQDRLYPYGYH